MRIARYFLGSVGLAKKSYSVSILSLLWDYGLAAFVPNGCLFILFRAAGVFGFLQQTHIQS